MSLFDFVCELKFLDNHHLFGSYFEFNFSCCKVSFGFLFSVVFEIAVAFDTLEIVNAMLIFVFTLNNVMNS